MKIAKTLFPLILCFFFLFSAKGDSPPSQVINLELQEPNRSFVIGPVAQGGTWNVRAYLRENGTLYTNFSNWGFDLYYGTNVSDTWLVKVPATNYNESTGSFDFHLKSNHTGSNGVFITWVYGTNTVENQNIEFRRGKSTFRGSAPSGTLPPLDTTLPLDLSIYTILDSPFLLNTGNFIIQSNTWGIIESNQNFYLVVDTNKSSGGSGFSGNIIDLNRSASNSMNGARFQTAGATEWTIGSQTNERKLLVINEATGENELVIDEQGQVGLGVDSPANNLHIRDTTPGITLENTGTNPGSVRIENVNGDVVVRTGGGLGLLRVNERGSSNVVVGASGNADLYVGATNGPSRLSVNGAASPTASNSFDLGTSDFPWRNLHLSSNIEFDGTLNFMNDTNIAFTVTSDNIVTGVFAGTYLGLSSQLITNRSGTLSSNGWYKVLEVDTDSGGNSFASAILEFNLLSSAGGMSIISSFSVQQLSGQTNIVDFTIISKAARLSQDIDMVRFGELPNGDLEMAVKIDGGFTPTLAANINMIHLGGTIDLFSWTPDASTNAGATHMAVPETGFHHPVLDTLGGTIPDNATYTNPGTFTVVQEFTEMLIGQTGASHNDEDDVQILNVNPTLMFDTSASGNPSFRFRHGDTALQLQQIDTSSPDTNNIAVFNNGVADFSGSVVRGNDPVGTNDFVTKAWGEANLGGGGSSNISVLWDTNILNGIGAIVLQGNGIVDVTNNGDRAYVEVTNTASAGGGSSIYEAGTGTGSIKPVGDGESSADYALNSGGDTNRATAEASVAVGGRMNHAAALLATIVGGQGNYAPAALGSIVGGSNNVVNAEYGFIGGGLINHIGGIRGVIGGGETNRIQLDGHGVIGGGFANWIDDDAQNASCYSVIAGGRQNTIGDANVGDQASSIGGGWQNSAQFFASTIGGGYVNIVTANYGTVSGGTANRASGQYGTVGGGENNRASASHTTAGGGEDNMASANWSTVGGGQQNMAQGTHVFVGGGFDNEASGSASTIAGGNVNVVGNGWTFIGGGARNRALYRYGVIGGGNRNTIENNVDFATIGGGNSNVIDHTNADSATIGGGERNRIEGFGGTIPGGLTNKVLGEASFAAGSHANANSEGSFVWSDKTGSHSDYGSNQFVIGASGGLVLPILTVQPTNPPAGYVTFWAITNANGPTWVSIDSLGTVKTNSQN